jgi:hypothetical protein
MKEITHFHLELIRVKNACSFSFMTPVSLGIDMDQVDSVKGFEFRQGHKYIFFFSQHPDSLQFSRSLVSKG